MREPAQNPVKPKNRAKNRRENTVLLRCIEDAESPRHAAGCSDAKRRETIEK
jgi:hypothetical protein